MNPATDSLLTHTTDTIGRGFDPRALWALFVLTLRQHLRGRRLLAFDTAKPSDDEVYDDDQRD